MDINKPNHNLEGNLTQVTNTLALTLNTIEIETRYSIEELGSLTNASYKVAQLDFRMLLMLCLGSKMKTTH